MASKASASPAARASAWLSAHAILKNAPILILDEPTAHLDAITEQAIMDELRSLIRGCTTLLITHRLTNLDMADEILVLDNGHIVEHGPHDMLMQMEGRYWRMMQRRAGEIVHNVTRL